MNQKIEKLYTHVYIHIYVHKYMYTRIWEIPGLLFY